jgi:hypothetical protein
MPDAQLRAGQGVPITELTMPQSQRMTRAQAQAGFATLHEAMTNPPPQTTTLHEAEPAIPASTGSAGSTGPELDRKVQEALDDEHVDRLLQAEIQVEQEVVFGTGAEGRKKQEQYKKWVEEQAEKLDWETLLLHNEARQRVRINDHVTVVFRSLSGGDSQGFLELLNDAKGSPLYLQDRMSFMQLAGGLYSYHSPGLNKVLPPYRDPKTRQFMRDPFLERLNFVLDLPLRLISLLQLNVRWFDQRVRDLSLPQVLGNG